MANVVGSVLGGTPVRMQAASVKEVRTALNLTNQYAGSVNGEPAQDGDRLSDEDFVSFSAAVKGGISTYII